MATTKTLTKKIFLSATMKLLTGLRIGDSKENVEIGGVDSPVVRRKDNNAPYIPGSSIKGKMRCLLQQVYGEMGFSHPKNGKSLICELFGAQGDDGNASRIIVRDADLTTEWEKRLRESEFTDMPYTEIKSENVIDRIRGTAEHPRQIERVPAGAEFKVEFIINIFKIDDKADNEKDLLKLFNQGITLLVNDYLGGSGSRGYGQIEFKNWKKEEMLFSGETAFQKVALNT